MEWIERRVTDELRQRIARIHKIFSLYRVELGNSDPPWMIPTNPDVTVAASRRNRIAPRGSKIPQTFLRSLSGMRTIKLVDYDSDDGDGRLENP